MKIKEFFNMTVGALFMAAGIYFFRFPNDFITGGAGGLAIVLARLLPLLSKSSYLMMINTASMVLGLVALGRTFAWRTVYCCGVYSVIVYLFELFIPMEQAFTDQPLLELIFAVGLCGIGSGLMFHSNASSGGIEVIAMIIKTKTSLSVGNALLYVNLAIALSAAVLFDMETCMFSVLGVLTNSLVVDNVIVMLSTSRLVIIITDKVTGIRQFIAKELNCGATFVNCLGSYSNEKKEMLFVALSPQKAYRLQEEIKRIDENSFMVILNTFDIIRKRA